MGTILKVKVRNFLNHENFHINLGKNVSFIVGKNGSGKSAVLTALVVGLGGRASVTSRGANLQSFIKYGENSASVEITIQNGPIKFFKREIYGDFIVVTRTLNISGGSSYKIKNDRGNVISTKYDEVSKICLGLNIQVDNPISVLNQTESQNFHASDAKKKYQYFMRATNLDTILDNYNNALANCSESKNTLKLKKEAYAIQKKELTNLIEKRKEFQSQEEINDQIQKLQNEYYWSEIDELESQLKVLQDSNSKQAKKVKHYNDQLIKYESLENKNKKLIDFEKQSYAEIAEARKQKSSEYGLITSKYQEIKTKWKMCTQQLNKKKEQIYKEAMKMKDIEKEIGKATNLNIENATETLERKKKLLHDQLAESVARKDTIKNELSQLRNAMLHLQNQYEQILSNQKKIEFSKKHIASQLSELSVRGRNNLAVFGSKMFDLVNIIRSNKKCFTEMPRGPIGSCLKVRDKKWSGALEFIIGQSLLSFCVTNDHDSRILFSLMQNVYKNERKPTVHTGKFYEKVHNVSKHAVRAPPGYFSALDALLIDDPVVANVLIDNLGLEAILLVPNQEDAISFTSKINNVPKNCRRVVTLDCSEFYPMPNYKSYGGKGLVSKYIQISSTERRMQLDNELNMKEAELNKLKMEVQELNEKKSKYRTQESDLDGRSQKFLVGIQNIEGKLAEIESNLKNLHCGHVKILNEELKSSQSAHSMLKEEESILATEELTMRNELKEMDKILHEMKSNKSSQEDRVINLKEKISQYQSQLDKTAAEMKRVREQLYNENKIFKSSSENIEKLDKTIQEKIDIAMDMCPRIVSPRNKDAIKELIKSNKLKMMAFNVNGMTKNEIIKACAEKDAECKKIALTLSSIEKLCKSAEEMAFKYLSVGYKLQKIVAGRVRYLFLSILTIKGYHGTMTFDHAKNVLEIFCSGRDERSKNSSYETLSLSGGERSYATVALLLSLWECMDVPFYVLDEFDIFMDVVNRKLIISLLLDHADKKDDKQFIFLTPLDTAFLVSSDKIKIFKLDDPVRERI